LSSTFTMPPLRNGTRICRSCESGVCQDYCTWVPGRWLPGEPRPLSWQNARTAPQSAWNSTAFVVSEISNLFQLALLGAYENYAISSQDCRFNRLLGRGLLSRCHPLQSVRRLWLHLPGRGFYVAGTYLRDCSSGAYILDSLVFQLFHDLLKCDRLQRASLSLCCCSTASAALFLLDGYDTNSLHPHRKSKFTDTFTMLTRFLPCIKPSTIGVTLIVTASRTVSH